MFDIITIGSATQDIFIESDLGKIINIKNLYSTESLLAFDYGAKIEIDKLASDIGGGAVNTAVNFSNLGFNTATIIKMGKDLNAQAVFGRLNEKNIDKSLVLESNEDKTGFSVILTSFEGDRTVLAHRGANSKISINEIPWDKIKEAKWIYIAPLSGDSNLVLDKLAKFAEENNVSMAFNPGTTQIKRGIEDLKKIIETAEVLVMNKSEASAITKIKSEVDEDSIKSNDKSKEDLEKELVHKMLFELKKYGPKVVVITDGKFGVFAFDGNSLYYAPPYPAKVLSTLGAGDAFASTFTAGLIKYNWNIEKSLAIASVNAAAIVENFGAQDGLKPFDELESKLANDSEYSITKYSLA